MQRLTRRRGGWRNPPTVLLTRCVVLLATVVAAGCEEPPFQPFEKNDSAFFTIYTYLDLYEKTLNSIADYQDKVGEQSQVEWVTTIANAQANFTRELATAYSSAARSLLK